jgi:hypothetical protein
MVPDHFTVALWIDFSCIDQDNVPETDLLGLEYVIAECDLLLTPVVDPDHETWSIPPRWEDVFDEYRAEEWRAYWTRAWCRLEVMLAATLPVRGSGSRLSEFKSGVLRNALGVGRRPHVLFGSKELALGTGPLFLPPLLHRHLELYAPEKGSMTVARDKAIISRICLKAKRFVEPAEDERYEGQLSPDGQAQGRGRKFWGSGKVYEGEFHAGQPHGHGRCRYAHWDVYEGQWQAGKRHGHGKQLYANGETYEGQWMQNKKHGDGAVITSQGERFDGVFENGQPSSEICGQMAKHFSTRSSTALDEIASRRRQSCEMMVKVTKSRGNNRAERSPDDSWYSSASFRTADARSSPPWSGVVQRLSVGIDVARQRSGTLRRTLSLQLRSSVTNAG